MEKMTKRDFFKAVAENEALGADIRQFAEEAIAKMDETNAKRAAKPSKAAIANAPLVEKIVAMLTDEPKTASDLCAPMEVGVHKASRLLQTAVAEGKASVQDVKIKGKGVQKGYTIAR